MNVALIWVVVGVLLILSELLATSIIAVFFGLAAIIVGLLVWAELLTSLEGQLFVFSVLSLVLLFTARAKLRTVLVGDVADRNDAHLTFRQNIGERANATVDFNQGQGRVRLNGVQWLAGSADPQEQIQDGDVVWIISNDGIRLTVSKSQPPTV